MSSFTEARELFRLGRTSESLLALRNFDSADASIVRTYALLRLDRVDEATAECLRLSIDQPSMDLVAEALIAHAYVDLRAGRFDSAQGLIDEARTYVYSAASAALEADYLNLEARAAYLRGDFELCAARSQAVLDTCEPFGLPERARPIASLATSRARAYEMLGFLRMRSGDFRGHLECLERATSIIDADPNADMVVKAIITANFAASVREVEPTAERYAQIVRLVSSIAWTSDLVSVRFNILHSAGWVAAVEGDHVGALRSFREAARIATDPFEILACHVDRAYLARELGQDLFASEEIAEALALAERLDLQNPSNEWFVILPMLAQLVSAEDPERAEALLAAYDSVPSRFDKRFGPKSEPRLAALATFAKAKVADARGERERAVAMFEEALFTWSSLGCAWRAGLAASELARLDPRYQPLAEAEVRSRPRSFFARPTVRLAS